jgi:hypothetical protein
VGHLLEARRKGYFELARAIEEELLRRREAEEKKKPKPKKLDEKGET